MSKDTPRILIDSFIKEALIYSEAIPKGDYKVGNKANKKMGAIYKRIKELNGSEKFKESLKHKDDGVRLCVASHLIKDFPELCMKVLKEIINKDNIYSLLAKMGIDLWEKGKL
jgi:hypothetical protein